MPRPPADRSPARAREPAREDVSGWPLLLGLATWLLAGALPWLLPLMG